MSGTLVEKLLDVVARFPDRECVVQGERRTTYRELGRQVASARSALVGRIAPGDRVALLLENSAEYVAACYGIWLAGGVVVGLNTALKASDLAHLLRHCDARCLIAGPDQRELGAVVNEIGADVAVLEVGPGGFDAGGQPVLPDERPEREALAAIIYTSGTTGQPKGVMLSHGNLAANADSICEYLAIDEKERALCVLPFYYSYGSSVMHSHVSRGAALVIENSFMYPHAVMARVGSERATSFAGVPSTFYLLLKRTDLSSFDFSSLRYVTQAGGRMEPDRIREFREKVPGASFVVMYGQTEATARLTWLPPGDVGRKSGSAGRAIPGVELRIRDDREHELSPGEVGEVCARGPNVMLGYWKEPAETERVLRTGWLHTGDLGHLDEEGYLFLRGRSQEMIKSGAHRISPAEIEDVIRSVVGVDDVAVTGTDDDVLGQAVSAFVIAAESSTALRQEILRTCRQALPLFKVPKSVEFRSEFPRTASGKVKKHLL